MGYTGNTINAHIASKGFYNHYTTYNPEKILDNELLENSNPEIRRANIAFAMAGCAGLTGATLAYCQKQQPKPKPAAVHPPFTAGPSTPTKPGTKVTPSTSKTPTYRITSDPRKDNDQVDDPKNTEGRSKADCEDACAALKEKQDGKCKDGSDMGGWNGSFNADGKCACDCASNDAPESATPVAATPTTATTPAAATTGIGGGLAGIYNSICASKIPFICDSPANFKIVFVIAAVVAAFMVFRSVMRR